MYLIFHLSQWVLFIYVYVVTYALWPVDINSNYFRGVTQLHSYKLKLSLLGSLKVRDGID